MFILSCNWCSMYLSFSFPLVSVCVCKCNDTLKIHQAKNGLLESTVCCVCVCVCCVVLCVCLYPHVTQSEPGRIKETFVLLLLSLSLCLPMLHLVFPVSFLAATTFTGRYFFSAIKLMNIKKNAQQLHSFSLLLWWPIFTRHESVTSSLLQENGRPGLFDTSVILCLFFIYTHSKYQLQWMRHPTIRWIQL